MVRFMPAFRTGLGAVLCLAIISCGGGGGLGPPGPGPGPGPGPSGSNVANVIVDQGPIVNGSPLGNVNTLFVTVTVCAPGSAVNCQSIDHVQVDTGSYGLRILASVLAAPLAAALPLQTDSTGNSLAECAVFADGYAWGPVALVDMQINGELAASMPTQIIGASTYAPVPSSCSSQAAVAEDTVEAFGANGILGIGPFAQDCPGCVSDPSPGAYYSCSATTCTPSTVPLANQTVNPVTLFARDNNGVIIQLPSVVSAGALTLTGTITFGIDTQSNNVSGQQSVFNVDGFAELTITFNGASLPNSFIDSGSNGNYFASTLATCSNQNISEFYCPNSTVVLAATIQGVGPSGAPIMGQSSATSFSVGSAQTILSTSNSAVPLLAGTLPSSLSQSFDYGLNFFYGRRVAVAVEGNNTTVGTGPYIAF
jgi:Protein of unknown function (DUF3443)